MDQKKLLMALLLLFAVCQTLAIETPKERKKVSDYFVPTKKYSPGKEYLQLMEKNVDYSYLKGRVTDKRKDGELLKVYTKHNNAKFLRAGDFVNFSLKKKKKPNCFAIVRDTEEFYVTLTIKNFTLCTGGEKFVRGGTFVHFQSEVLKKRIMQAAQLRMQLLKEKTNLMKRKKELRLFLWSYDQQRMKTSAGYEKLLVGKMNEKQTALDDHLTRKQDAVRLQAKLKKRLNEIDQDLKFYHVDRSELGADQLPMHPNQFPPKLFPKQ